MAQSKFASVDKVATVVRQALSRGATVEIDGLGSFRKIGDSYTFQPRDLPRVFIAYVHEDAEQADRIFDALLAAGFEPWMDRRKLLPGQNWARSLQNAMDTSDFAVCCFSQNSIRKRSGFQAEIRYALECAHRLPLDEIFLLPVRLDSSPVPLDVAREMHYVDMFPDWDSGIGLVIEAIRQQLNRKRAA
jgi:hypothetical protein